MRLNVSSIGNNKCDQMASVSIPSLVAFHRTTVSSITSLPARQGYLIGKKDAGTRPILMHIAISILAAMTSVIAQTGIRNRGCATKPSADDVLRMEKNFAAKRSVSDIEARIENLTTVHVNVYFHVIYKDDTVEGGSVSADQLDKQIDVLNTDYYNASIIFNLVNVSRTQNSDWFHLKHDGDPQLQMKENLRIGTASDLNVYLVGMIDDGDIYGYTTFPNPNPANPKTDGAVIMSSTLPGGSEKGQNLGRILTHEVGHWAGLYELFEGGCKGTDYVDDTPQLMEQPSGCPTSGKVFCGEKDFQVIHNFMSISECMYEFSDGQVSLMRQQIVDIRGLVVEN